jgi:hypothetical protein
MLAIFESNKTSNRFSAYNIFASELGTFNDHR